MNSFDRRLLVNLARLRKAYRKAREAIRGKPLVVAVSFGSGMMFALTIIFTTMALTDTIPKRCHDAFPRNDYRAEQCIFDLNHGLRP